jgi:hypothetical protein
MFVLSDLHKAILKTAYENAESAQNLGEEGQLPDRPNRDCTSDSDYTPAMQAALGFEDGEIDEVDVLIACCELDDLRLMQVDLVIYPCPPCGAPGFDLRGANLTEKGAVLAARLLARSRRTRPRHDTAVRSRT